jgi:predicted phosphodiesterase
VRLPRILARMRLAVVADVHGNLPALRAVLAEVEADAIVVAGDVVGGPQPREVLEALAARPEPVHWIAGNAERETLAVLGGRTPADEAPGRAARWSADALDASWAAAMAGWPIRLALDGTCFCHGSPRRDDEILTRATPEAALREALAGVPERLVVGGHTHQQLRRERYANAGSVGMPYEGRPGAFWLVVEDGQPEHRVTAYDLDAAAAELRATGYPDVEDLLAESLLDPVAAGYVTDLFERASGRDSGGA